MGESFGIGEIVNGDELDSGIIQSCADKAAANAAEAVNSYFHGH
jgi:hypothetical protein